MAAWTGAEIAGDPSWVVPCPDAVARDLRDFIPVVVDRIERLGEPIDVAARVLGPTRAWSPQLADLAITIRAELLAGRGFALLRGVPVEGLTATAHDVVCWLICAEIGVPIRQNVTGDRIVRVADLGKNVDELGVRSYETAASLDYHSDSSDVVALYCVRPAMQGGTSTIVSAVAVHDAVVQSRPDLAPLLFEPWSQASPVSLAVEAIPVCARNDDGKVFTRYGRRYIDTAREYDASVAPLTPQQTELLDLYDGFLHDPAFALDMAFRPGDIQFLDNFTVMHARTDYVDWPEPERRRELLRMWLVLPERIDLPPVFADSGFIPRSQAFTDPSDPSHLTETP